MNDLRQGDQVTVVDGEHAGEGGRVVCVHRDIATIIRPDNVGITTEVKYIKRKEVVNA